jgi:hypothetical protein
MKTLSVGERVTLRSFRGTASAPEETRDADNYWLLIGQSGTVVDTDDVSKIGRHPNGARMLVTLDQKVAEMGLACHNEVPNALWLFASDLVPNGATT